jgi:hypothetical protein
MLSAATRLDPEAIYDDALLYRELGIPTVTLARARREGRLRYARQGQRIFYVGRWVRTWLGIDDPQENASHA